MWSFDLLLKRAILTLQHFIEFTVPIAGAKGTSIAIWVGIDGVATDAPGIQGGIHVSVGDDGIASYETWTEWIPDLAVSYDQDTFSFKSGDGK